MYTRHIFSTLLPAKLYIIQRKKRFTLQEIIVIRLLWSQSANVALADDKYISDQLPVLMSKITDNDVFHREWWRYV